MGYAVHSLETIIFRHKISKYISIQSSLQTPTCSWPHQKKKEKKKTLHYCSKVYNPLKVKTSCNVGGRQGRMHIWNWVGKVLQ